MDRPRYSWSSNLGTLRHWIVVADSGSAAVLGGRAWQWVKRGAEAVAAPGGHQGRSRRVRNRITHAVSVPASQRRR